ncbi:MAG: DUF11 domain-containing protein, partial [Bacteroidales bacterium]|nr:DUF11 domain-containing protein [Bacteroidales bacterium]
MKGVIFFGGKKMHILLKLAVGFAALMIVTQAFPNNGVSFSIEKTGPVVASPGDLITYTISYSNTGTSLAHSVLIKDFLPSAENLEYVSSTPEGIYNSGSNSITWSSNEIPGLALLGSGTNFIIVTLRVGKTGVPPIQSEIGYYLTSDYVELENYASIQSDEVTIPVLSNTVTTVATQICTFTLSEPNSGIKSASNSTLTYIVAITNTGNIYQQFSLQTALVSGQNLFQSIQTLNGDPLSITPFIAPGETYFFHYVLTTPNGTKPNETTVTNITATPSICGNPVTSNFSTLIYGGNYNTYQLLGVYKIDNPDPVQSGNFLTYQVVISNAGDNLANVRVIETYPDNTTYVSANPPPTTGNNIWDFTNLPPGNSFITITVQVENDLPNGTILTNTVSVGSLTTVTSFFEENTTVLSAPDLSIIKTAIIENPPAEPGSLVYYTLSYQNNGNSTALNVVIRDNYNEQYMEIYDDGGGNTSVFGEISWTFPALAPGQSGTIQYTLRIIDNPGIFPAGTTNISNTATIINNLTDSNINDNISTATISVSNLPDLKAEKTSSISPALVLQPLTYHLSISNIGRIAHTGNYTVTDYLPIGTNYLSSNPAGVYDSETHTVNWVISSPLAPNQSEEFSITLAGIDCELAGSSLLNRITVFSSNLADADNSNNTFLLLTPVIDNVAPVITLPPTELVLQCFDIELVNAWIATASATDNCDTEIEIFASFSEPENNCNQSVTVTFTATDSYGNTSSETKEFLINDTTAPIWDQELPDDITVECDEMPGADVLTATDNCDTDLPVEFSEFQIEGECAGSYTLIRNWTATDNCGNHISHAQTITVLPAPQAQFPSVDPITISCDQAFTFVPSNLAYTNSGLGGCLIEGQVMGVVSGEYDECGGKLTQTWTFTDDCNRTSTQTQTITVQPAPQAQFPSVDPINISCDQAATFAPTNLTFSNAGLGGCLIEGQVLGVISGTYDECGGTITQTWTFVDDCNRTSTQTQTITVDPAPQAQFAAVTPQTISCDAATTFAASNLTYTNEGLGGCLISGQVMGVITGTYDECGGTLTQTWTFVDDCGRTSTQTQTITVDPAPQAQFADVTPQTITCDAATTFAASNLTYTNEGLGGCLISGQVVGVITGTYDECGGTLTQTWTFTDACNRTITHSQTITVLPAPVATFINPPADITITCNDATTFAATSLSYSNAGLGGCLIESSVQGVISGSYTECGGTLTQTWTFTDACGRQIQHVQNITVEPAPVAAWINPPGDITISCDEATTFAASSLSYSNDGLGGCLISGSVTGVISGTYNECGGTLTQTWTFTDACGRQIQHVQNITVEPAPVAAWINPPGDITISCDEATTFA